MHRPIPHPISHNDYQKFRPKYPLDPFDSFDKPSKSSPNQLQQIPKEPWRLNVDKLPPAELTKLCRSVILVIGQHPSQQLLSLFKSQHFFSSLIIIATHAPVYLPSGVYPSVRILKLNEPLDVENRGAERLVRTLEWADRVARIWRVHGGGGITELQESAELDQSQTENRLSKGDHPMHADTLPRPPKSSNSAPSVLRSSVRSPLDASGSRFNSAPARATKTRKRSSSFLPPPNPAQRSFDVLINFLPATGIPDGYLLKNVILVTTISRPFVIATSPENLSEKKKARAQSVMESTRSSRWSLFRNSRSFPSTMTPASASTSSLGHGGHARSSQSISNMTVAPSLAHSMASSHFTLTDETFSNTNPALIVHILPSPPPHPHTYVYTQKQLAARDKLVGSIDSFLCAFGASQASFSPALGKAALDSTMHGDDKRAFATGAIPRARPYLVDGNSFANDALNASGDGDCEWSLAELLCCGCLDPNPSPPNLKEGKKEHKVWISGISDIILSSSSASGSVGDSSTRSLPSDEDSPPSNTPPLLTQPSHRPLPPPPHISYSVSQPSSSSTSANQLNANGVKQSYHLDTFAPGSDLRGAATFGSYTPSRPSGLPSPGPPPIPEKDRGGWGDAYTASNGHIRQPIGPYVNDQLPRNISEEKKSQQMNYPSAPHPRITNPLPIPPDPSRAYAPHYRLTGHRPMTQSAPPDNKKTSRWKFWK